MIVPEHTSNPAACSSPGRTVAAFEIQVATLQRLLAQVSAERDEARQQLADLKRVARAFISTGSATQGKVLLTALNLRHDAVCPAEKASCEASAGGGRGDRSGRGTECEATASADGNGDGDTAMMPVEEEEESGHSHSENTHGSAG